MVVTFLSHTHFILVYFVVMVASFYMVTGLIAMGL